MMHSVLVLFAAVAAVSAGEPGLQPVLGGQSSRAAPDARESASPGSPRRAAKLAALVVEGNRFVGVESVLEPTAPALQLHSTGARVGEGSVPPGFLASREKYPMQQRSGSTLLAANEERGVGVSSGPREPPSGVTGVMVAAMKGYAAVIKALLAAGSDINAQDSDGKTALLWALDNGQSEAAQVLLDSGANVNVRSNNGETALASAARTGDINSVRALLGKGADVNAQNNEGSSSLMHAAMNGHTNVLKALLDAGADPDVRANDGKTALMVAAWNGHADIVRALLDSGSIVDTKSNDGWTAATYAARKSHDEIVQLLRESEGYEEAWPHVEERLRKLKQKRKSSQERAIREAQASKDSKRLARKRHARPPPRIPPAAPKSIPPAVPKIGRVAHEFIGDQNLPVVSIRVTVAGAVRRTDVFVATGQGFSPHTMYDDGTHGDPIPGDGEYRAEITLADPTRSTRYYVVAYMDGGLAVYKPAPAGTETYVIEPVVIGPPVVINEFMARNKQTIADPQGDYDGWIELYNTTSATVDLTGYYLSDDPGKAKKWRFPTEIRLAGYGYLIVWTDREPAYTNISSQHSELHANFELSRFGEQILLTDSDGYGVLDSVSFGRQRRDVSMGRSPNGRGEFRTMPVPTPGWANR